MFLPPPATANLQRAQQRTDAARQLDGAADSSLQVWGTGAATFSRQAGQCCHSHGSHAESSISTGAAAVGAPHALPGECSME